MRRGLISICIIAAVAFGCVSHKDVQDAGVDVQEDGPCATWEPLLWCEDGQRHWRIVNADCSVDNGDEYCYVGCDDAGVDCVPFP